jgi:hypothetical protein
VCEKTLFGAQRQAGECAQLAIKCAKRHSTALSVRLLNARNSLLSVRKDTLLAARSSCLEAVAASAAFRVTAASITDMNFTQRAIIPCAVILTFRYATTDTGVHFLYVFVHHNKKSSFFSTNSMGKFLKDY